MHNSNVNVACITMKILYLLLLAAGANVSIARFFMIVGLKVNNSTLVGDFGPGPVLNSAKGMTPKTVNSESPWKNPPMMVKYPGNDKDEVPIPLNKPDKSYKACNGKCQIAFFDRDKCMYLINKEVVFVTHESDFYFRNHNKCIDNNECLSMLMWGVITCTVYKESGYYGTVTYGSKIKGTHEAAKLDKSNILESINNAIDTITKNGVQFEYVIVDNKAPIVYIPSQDNKDPAPKPEDVPGITIPETADYLCKALKYTNDIRAAASQGSNKPMEPLQLSQALIDSSTVHSRAMAKTGYIYHEQHTWDRIASYTGIRNVAMSENVASSQTGSRKDKCIMTGFDGVKDVGSSLIYTAACQWFSSPEHYKNIVNPDFRFVGFGHDVVKSGNKDKYYWTQNFSGKVNGKILACND